MKKVLILGIAPVQADAIVLLNELGVTTYSCAKADDGPGSKLSNYFQIIDFIDIDRVIQHIAQNNIDCVYSVGSDIAVPICSNISERLNLPFFVNSDTAKICNNKNLMRDYLGDNFTGNVVFQVLHDKKETIKLNYPFILKPSDSQGQRGVRLVNNHNDFSLHFDASKRYSRSGLVIIEDYIDGPELSINAYLVEGSIKICIISDRITWPDFHGGLIRKHVIPSNHINKKIERNLIDLVENISSKLQIKNGPLYLQVKIRNEHPYLIEASPRLDGCHMWHLIEYYSKVNLLKLTFEHLLYGKTDELCKLNYGDCGFTLEFLCEKPEELVNYSKFTIPKNVITQHKYYKDGEMVRPINGQFEKIGYFIFQNSR